MLKDKLSVLIKERGIKPHALARETGVTSSTIDDLLKGKTNELNIGVDKVLRIANYFGITVEELYDRAPAALSLDERSLLSLFDNLNEEGRERLLIYAQDLVASGRYIKSVEAGVVSEEA